MWLFTTMGFISAVVDRNDGTLMFVRSRNAEHLRALLRTKPPFNRSEASSDFGPKLTLVQVAGIGAPSPNGLLETDRYQSR